MIGHFELDIPGDNSNSTMLFIFFLKDILKRCLNKKKKKIWSDFQKLDLCINEISLDKNVKSPGKEFCSIRAYPTWPLSLQWLSLLFRLFHTHFKFYDISGNLWEKAYIFFSVFILMQYIKVNQKEGRRERQGRKRDRRGGERVGEREKLPFVPLHGVPHNTDWSNSEASYTLI